MQHILDRHRIALGVLHLFEHTAVVFLGLVMMMVSVAMGASMTTLPAGVVIGLLGVLLFLGGIFAHTDANR